MAEMTRLAVVDDDRMLLDGLARWLAAEPGLCLSGSYTTVDALMADPPVVDVVLLDLMLRDGSSAVDNVARLVAVLPRRPHRADLTRWTSFAITH